MWLTLLCEVCASRRAEYRLGVFEIKDLVWPLDPTIFRTPRAGVLPDPFPAVKEWDVARCRQCGSRPFLNAIPQRDGTVMLIDGRRYPRGAEGRILTLEQGYIPIPGYPGGPKVVSDNDGNLGVVVEQIGPGAPPASDATDGPATCPVCGREYQSAANLAKYHRCKGAR